MKRREFSAQLHWRRALSLGLAALRRPRPGRPGRRAAVRAAGTAAAGGARRARSRSIEFFWYGCPHCNAFEPKLEAWVKKLPADVPAAACRWPSATTRAAPAHVLHARGPGQGRRDARARCSTPSTASSSRLDKRGPRSSPWPEERRSTAPSSWSSTTRSRVQTKARQARTWLQDYKVDGVPALGIAGRYYTVGHAGRQHRPRAAVADYLIAEAPQGGAEAAARSARRRSVRRCGAAETGGSPGTCGLG